MITLNTLSRKGRNSGRLPRTLTILSPRILACLAGIASWTISASAEPPAGVISPNGSLAVTVDARGPLTYQVQLDGKPLLASSRLGLAFGDGLKLGEHADVLGVEQRTSDTWWRNDFGKSSKVRDHFNETRIHFKEISAAKHHLMVNFHGAYVPTGLARTWPNYITQEGILANEYSKFSGSCDPKHHITLPFTRNLLGPADFTPGGFLNRSVSQWRKTSPTQVMGTRARQLALATLLDSPLLCMADSPANYRGQTGLEYFRGLPTVWDETRVLSANLAEHLVEARRKGDIWYIAAMNHDKPLTLRVPLDFLGDGEHTIRIFADKPESATTATEITDTTRPITAKDSLEIPMVGDGGFAAVIIPPTVLPSTGVSFRTSDAALQRHFDAAEAKAASNIVQFTPTMKILVEGGGYQNAWINGTLLGHNGDQIERIENLPVELAVGDEIRFVVDPNGSNGGDYTLWDTTLSFQPCPGKP
ncbi:MAG: glycoside hydrolase family 97 catalytic domain-containing protein [Verrucomicrobiota bacterium]